MYVYIYILYGVKAEQKRRNILSMKQSSDQLRNFCVNFERITIGLHKRGGWILDKRVFDNTPISSACQIGTIRALFFGIKKAVDGKIMVRYG